MTIAPAASDGAKGEWELFCHDGEMKLYTRELVTKDRFQTFHHNSKARTNSYGTY